MHAAILRTLAYADIFDYPLTASEIHHWLIQSSHQSSVFRLQQFKKDLKTAVVRSQLAVSQGYYFLKGRRHLIPLRQKRQHFSRQKIKLARRVGKWLKFIPTIKLVGITGALAMNNADKNDDIDLMIVTTPNLLWLTRLVVIPLISLIAKRRKPNTSGYTLVANHFCLNLWLDEISLSIPSSQRNLYTAHEIAQVKPLWSRGEAYQKFLSANSWVNNYLPNIKISQAPSAKRQAQKHPLNSILYTLYSILSFLNQVAFHFQYLYMKPKITRERVSLHSAFFHPNNTRKYVMAEYHKRLKQLSINS